MKRAIYKKQGGVPGGKIMVAAALLLTWSCTEEIAWDLKYQEEELISNISQLVG